MENDKDGTSSRLTEHGLGFQKPPTSWAATSEAQIKHALREGNCWPLLASPDHSPLTRLCNSQNIPLVIIIPTKKENKQIPAFHLIFSQLCVIVGSLPLFSLFFFLRWIDMKYFPSVSSLSSVSPPPSVAALPPTHPFLIGPHYRLLSVSRRQVGRSRRSLSCLKNFCFRRRLQLSAVSKPLVSEAQLTFTTCQSTADLYFPPEELVEKETGH